MCLKKIKEKTMKIQTILLSTVALILGGLIGSGFGMLYAPRSGRATRAILRNKGVEFQESVTENINMAGVQAKTRIGHLGLETRHKVAELGGQLKDTVSSIPMPFPSNGH
jgi:gas vesicle protein